MVKFKQHSILVILPTLFASTIIICYFHFHPEDKQKIKIASPEERKVNIYPNVFEEISKDGLYGRKYFAWVGESWPNQQTNKSVCLSTHGSPDYLHWVELHARLWKGPISVAVYAAGLNFMVAYNRIKYLRKCFPAVMNLVSFHIVFPLNNPALFKEEDIIDVECVSEQVINTFQTILSTNHSADIITKFPQNHARNTARNACPTTHTMSVDIDMIPWEGMSEQMDKYFSNIEFQNCAYIVPVYEIHSTVKQFPPNSKLELISLLKEKKARIFHKVVFSPNQNNSGLTFWEKNNSTNQKQITISHRVQKYQQYWEPILVLHSSAPQFFERFIGYGFTRNSHVYYLNLLHYHFIVLDNAFLSHLGFQEKSKIYTKSRKMELSKNSKIYINFKKEMAKKYEK